MIQVCGLDWAAQPKGRAAVVLREATNGAGLAVRQVLQPVSDEAALELCRDAETLAVGVDVPFGWPTAFVRLVSSWSLRHPAPIPVPESGEYRLRRTDGVVWSEVGKYPMSVAADRISLATRAWLRVVTAGGLGSQIDWGAGPRRPSGPPVLEVYPGGTLAALCPRGGAVLADGYKQSADVRGALLDALVEIFSLRLGPGQRAEIVGTDADPFDALLAALTAWMYLAPLAGWVVRRPTAEELPAAGEEGWIFFPVPAAAQQETRP